MRGHRTGAHDRPSLAGVGALVNRTQTLPAEPGRRRSGEVMDTASPDRVSRDLGRMPWAGTVGEGRMPRDLIGWWIFGDHATHTALVAGGLRSPQKVATVRSHFPVLPADRRGEPATLLLCCCEWEPCPPTPQRGFGYWLTRKPKTRQGMKRLLPLVARATTVSPFETRCKQGRWC